MGTKSGSFFSAPSLPPQTEEERLQEENERLEGELTKALAEADRQRQRADALQEQIDEQIDQVDLSCEPPSKGLGGKILDFFKRPMPGMKVSRQKVYESVDSERAHAINIGYSQHERPTWIAIMEHYLMRAKADMFCSKKPEGDELDNIRKVVASGVGYMEQYGAPPRVKSKRNPIPGQPDTHAPR